MTGPARRLVDQQQHPYKWFSTWRTDWSPAVAAVFAMPDSAERRLALGHVPEPDCPGYCTCGQLCREPEPGSADGGALGYWRPLQ